MNDVTCPTEADVAAALDPTPVPAEVPSNEPASAPEAALDAADDRREITNTKVSPYVYVCQLYMQKDPNNEAGSLGTGFLVAPNVIVTCGHNLWSNSALGGGFVFKRFTIIPGRRSVGTNDTQPLGKRDVLLSPKGFKVHTGWSEKKDRNYDVGLIVLPPGKEFPVKGNTLSYGGISIPPSAPRGRYTVLGYPKAKPLYTMWGSLGQIDTLERNILYYRMMASEGQSGGPIIATRDDGTLGNVVVGIHIAEERDGTRRAGLAMTQAIQDWITKNSVY